MENGTIEVARRDTLTKESRPIEGIADYVANLLGRNSSKHLSKSLKFREENTFKVETWDEFKAQIEKGGFISRIGTELRETEEKIKTGNQSHDSLYSFERN